jgi:RNA 2',3'-cyclic 3'-phosphodiesterase
MRLFTAVELPETVRAAVRSSYEAEIAPQLPGPRAVRPVAAENLHVTVRFLGETPEAALTALCEALSSAAAEVPSAESVRVRGFGAFPSARAPRVLWAGIDDPSRTIALLEGAVSRRIAPLGFAPEERPYTPHVTVARVAEGRRRGRGARGPRPPQTTLALPSEIPLGPEFPVRELSLVLSELTPRGALYRTLARFPLSAPPSTSSRHPQE